MANLVIRVRQGDKAKALARSLKERVPNLTCRACGRRDFALLEQPEHALRTVLTREFLDGKDSELVGLKKQPLVTVVCTNCGHIEQFAEAVIRGVQPDAYGAAVGDE